MRFDSTVICWVDTNILAPSYLTIIISNYHSILVDAFYFYQNLIFFPHVTCKALFLNSVGFVI